MEAAQCDPRQLEMLRRIMQVEFELIELNLFLDTHPEDCAALSAFQMYAEQLACLKRDYEAVFGPLLNFGFGMAPNGWQWINDPWPWEINWRKGV
ncbi:MAG: spore coat protein CotJB [Bacillota bacterium]